MDDLDFPAMSFALLNPLRRTVVGGSDLLKIAAANVLADTKGDVLSYINLVSYYDYVCHTLAIDPLTSALKELNYPCNRQKITVDFRCGLVRHEFYTR